MAIAFVETCAAQAGRKLEGCTQRGATELVPWIKLDAGDQKSKPADIDSVR